MMLHIKQSSAPDESTPEIGHNSFKKVNKTFCHFATDYISMALYFDTWNPFALQNAPVPYTKEEVNCLYAFCIYVKCAISNLMFTICLISLCTITAH